MSNTEETEMTHELIQTRHDVNKGELNEVKEAIEHLIQKIDSLHVKVDALSNKLDHLTNPSPAITEPVLTQVGRFLGADQIKIRDRRYSDMSECSRHSAESVGSGYVNVSMPGGNAEPLNKENRNVRPDDNRFRFSASHLQMCSIALSSLIIFTFIYRSS